MTPPSEAAGGPRQWYDSDDPRNRTRSVQWWPRPEPPAEGAPVLGDVYRAGRPSPGDVWGLGLLVIAAVTEEQAESTARLLLERGWEL